MAKQKQTTTDRDRPMISTDATRKWSNTVTPARVLEVASDLKFGTGLYLLTAPPAHGKSVGARALASMINRQTGAEIGCLNFFEVGAPVYSQQGTGSLFQDPGNFLHVGGGGDIYTHLASYISGRTFESKIDVWVFDAIGVPLKTYDPTKRNGMPAAEQGMQLADRMFVERLNSFGEQHALIIFGIVDSQVVPFTEKLYGATQGIIKVLGADRITKGDRVSGRDPRQISIPSEDVKLAASAMGYPEREFNQSVTKY